MQYELHKKHNYIARLIKVNDSTFVLEMPPNIIYNNDEPKSMRFRYSYEEGYILASINDSVINTVACPRGLYRLILTLEVIKRFDDWKMNTSLCDCFDKDESISFNNVIECLEHICDIYDDDLETKVIDHVFTGIRTDKGIEDECRIIKSFFESDGLIS